MKTHLSRKTPCVAVVAVPCPPMQCGQCGRAFTTRQAASRHQKARCKAPAPAPDQLAPPDELVASDRPDPAAQQLAAKVDALRSQIDTLTELFERRAAAPQIAVQATQINTGPVTNIVTIMPWDGDHRIDVSASQIAAAFVKNSLLREYVRCDERSLLDPKVAPRYVTELLMDLVRRVHENPSARNVYLNPKRSDQVLVHLKVGSWEVLPLADATRMLLDGVAEAIHRVALSPEERTQLPLDAQAALSIAGLLYNDGPDDYARLAKVPMASHLQNTAPPQVPSGPAPPQALQAPSQAATTDHAAHQENDNAPH